MTQHVSNPPEENPPEQPNLPAESVPIENPQPLQPPKRQAVFAKSKLLPLLAFLVLLIVTSSGLLVWTLFQTVAQATTTTLNSTPTVSATGTTTKGTHTPTPVPSPVITPTNGTEPPVVFPGIQSNQTGAVLQLPTNHYVLYEEQTGIYMVSTSDITDASGVSPLPKPLTTPGYVYNQAVRPILTPSNQLLYSGTGIWLLDIFSGATAQIATIDSSQVITSMALSSDGTTIAWSTEPSNGKGVIDLYAGPLNNPVKVLEQSASDCPCFHIFSFLNGTSKQSDTTLLLSDDQNTHQANLSGLWSFDLSNPSNAPVQLLDESSQQGPLAQSPYSNVLLYSSNEGVTPPPTDNSVPDDVATLLYANSLDIATLSGQPLSLGAEHVILPEQHNLSNKVDYHWVTTPIFTTDGRNILYVEFNSSSQPPYDRTSAIFQASITTGSGGAITVGSPHLIATANARLLELGPWFNNHVLTFYGNDTLYAVDMQSGAVATIVETGVYARLIAVINDGQA